MRQLNTLQHTDSLSKLILKKTATPSVFVFLIIVLFSATTFKFWINWGGLQTPFQMDVDQYYSYLIAQFKAILTDNLKKEAILAQLPYSIQMERFKIIMAKIEKVVAERIE